MSDIMIIGLSGPAMSGKTTAANYLTNYHGFEHLRFAGPLKAMLRALGLTEREVDGDLKEEPSALLGGRTPRYAMQTIGTEWGRNLIDPDLWLRAWSHSVDECLSLGHSVVVDDVRFPNEVEELRRRGGRLIRLERPNGQTISTRDHISEQLLARPDVTYTNDGTIRQLQEAIDYIIRGDF